MPQISTKPDDYAVRTIDMRVDYGNFVAVHELCLNVPRGEIYGLIGPNGAGKTSSFKVLATLMEPTYGDVFIGGVDIALQPEEARKHLGYMPDLAPIATDLKVWEFLDLFAGAHGIQKNLLRTRRTRIEECLEKVSLTDKSEEYCKNLSRGMMQRLVLAKTLLHRPSLFLLDEPASGMDPVSRQALRQTVRELASEGAAVLLSSHILSELEDMCTMVGLMSKGILVDSGPINEVINRRSSNERTLIASCLESPGTLLKFLEWNDQITETISAREEVIFTFIGTDDEQATLLTDIIGSGIRLRSLREQKKSIEQVLLEIDSNPQKKGEK